MKCSYGFVKCTEEATFTVYDFKRRIAILGCAAHVGMLVRDVGRSCMVKPIVGSTPYSGDLADRSPNDRSDCQTVSEGDTYARSTEPNQAEEDSGIPRSTCSRRGCGCRPQRDRQVDRGGAGGARQAGLGGDRSNVSRASTTPSSPYTPSHAPTVGGYR